MWIYNMDSKMINVALPKGRLGEKVYKMFEEAGYGCPDIFEGRKLVFESKEAGVRYFWVKPSDVPIYVERGAADIGVAGKDILLEYEPNVYELKEADLLLIAQRQYFRKVLLRIDFLVLGGSFVFNSYGTAADTENTDSCNFLSAFESLEKHRVRMRKIGLCRIKNDLSAGKPFPDRFCRAVPFTGKCKGTKQRYLKSIGIRIALTKGLSCVKRTDGM